MKSPARIGFLLLFAVIRCSTAHATHALGGQVPIGLGQSADFAGGLRVTFTSLVSDSRCPEDVTCIQAGEAVVALTYSSRHGASETVRVSSARSKNQVEIAGHLVELLGVSAHEHGGPDVVVTLRVSAR